MATSLSEYISSLEINAKEIDLLIENAKSTGEDNPLSKAICRSASVLMISHFEAFYKELVKRIIDDLNDYLEFSDLNDAVKRTYCSRYVGGLESHMGSKEYQAVCLKLAGKFSENKTKISWEPFLPSSNQNPKEQVIDKIFSQFGIKKVFDYLSNSKTEVCFKGDKQKIVELLAEMKGHVLMGVESFPYSINLDLFDLSKSHEINSKDKAPQVNTKEQSKDQVKEKSFWPDFIQESLRIRHDVVHGTTHESKLSVLLLEENKQNFLVLKLSLISILGAELMRTSNLSHYKAIEDVQDDLAGQEIHNELVGTASPKKTAKKVSAKATSPKKTARKVSAKATSPKKTAKKTTLRAVTPKKVVAKK